MSGVSFVNDQCTACLNKVRSDASPENWVLYQYADNGNSKSALEVLATGEGSLEELKAHLDETKVIYGLLRVQTGDAFSRRIKFVFITFVGESVSPLKRAKVSTHKLPVGQLMGNYAVDVHYSGITDVDEAEIATKLKKAGGADYDGQAQNAATLVSPSVSPAKVPAFAPAAAEPAIEPAPATDEPAVESAAKPAPAPEAVAVPEPAYASADIDSDPQEAAAANVAELSLEETPAAVDDTESDPLGASA